jgi:hypothetical protein
MNHIVRKAAVMMGGFCALLLLGIANSGQPLGSAEGSRLRGGAASTTCVNTAVNLTTGCDGKITYGAPIPPSTENTQYKCSGTNYDQGCPVAYTNTGNVCDNGFAVCSGTQQKSTDGGKTWSNDGNCSKVTYNTARAQAKACVPGIP